MRASRRPHRAAGKPLWSSNLDVLALAVGIDQALDDDQTLLAQAARRGRILGLEAALEALGSIFGAILIGPCATGGGATGGLTLVTWSAPWWRARPPARQRRYPEAARRAAGSRSGGRRGRRLFLVLNLLEDLRNDRRRRPVDLDDAEAGDEGPHQQHVEGDDDPEDRRLAAATAQAGVEGAVHGCSSGRFYCCSAKCCS